MKRLPLTNSRWMVLTLLTMSGSRRSKRTSCSEQWRVHHPAPTRSRIWKRCVGAREVVCRSTRGKGAQSVGGAAVNLRSVLAAVARSFEVRRNENGLRRVRDGALTLLSRAKADEAKIDDEE